jgi:hypothetical protein
VGARLDRAVYCVVKSRRSERPTVPPSFDVAQYAKDSEARIRAGRPTVRAGAPARSQPPPLELDFDEWSDKAPRPESEVRLATRPNLAATPTDEAWARAMVGTPYAAIPGAQLRDLPIGHRAGFLLSRMDGATDLETVIALSAMPRDEALRMVRDLYESGVVAFR